MGFVPVAGDCSSVNGWVRVKTIDLETFNAPSLVWHERFFSFQSFLLGFTLRLL